MLRRVTAVLAVITAVFLVVVPPASAGGPTSVLIASPAKQRTAALYATQSDYQDLENYLGENPRASDKDAPAKLSIGPNTSAVNVTWLIHDVQIWRIDRVVMDATGGPWVETTIATPGNMTDLGTPVVHRPASPKQLSALLDRLLADQATTLPAVVPAAAPVSPPAPEPAWHWASALLGLAGGVVVMIGVQLVFGLLPRRRAVASP